MGQNNDHCAGRAPANANLHVALRAAVAADLLRVPLQVPVPVAPGELAATLLSQPLDWAQQRRDALRPSALEAQPQGVCKEVSNTKRLAKVKLR